MATTNKDDNVFDDLEKALEWARKHNVSSAALQRLQSTEGLRDGSRESLLFHTIRYTSDQTSPSGTMAFETSCLLTKHTRVALGTREHILPLPPLPSTLPFKLQSIPPGQVGFNIQDKGLYATDDIAVGTLIVVEHPLLLSPTYMCLSGLSMTKAELYGMLFQRLPEHLKKAALTLRNAKGNTCSREEGIVRTNGIAVELEPDGHGESAYSGVFSTVSRCNHRFVRFILFCIRCAMCFLSVDVTVAPLTLSVDGIVAPLVWLSTL
jgi:hypothetical protein